MTPNLFSVLDGRPTEVVGVMPAGFAFPSPDVETWLPTREGDGATQGRGNSHFLAVGRLRTGVSPKAAQAQVDFLARGIQEANPDHAEWRHRLQPLHAVLFGDMRTVLLLLLGGALGLALAQAGAVLLRSVGPSTIPPMDELGIDAVALPMAGALDEAAAQQRRPYAFGIEIVECRPGGCARGHKPGDVFAYPAEKGRICEWLMDSMSTSIRVLQQGGTLPWLYQGTPYEKVIDPDGITTEFIRCPDPTSGPVAKITRARTA